MLLWGLPHRQLVSSQTLTNTLLPYCFTNIYNVTAFSYATENMRRWRTQQNPACRVSTHKELRKIRATSTVCAFQHWRFVSYILLAEETWLLLHSPFEPLLEDGQVFLQPPDLLPLDPCDFTIPVHVPERRRNSQLKNILVFRVLMPVTQEKWWMRASLTCPCTALGGTPAYCGSSQVGPKPG